MIAQSLTLGRGIAAAAARQPGKIAVRFGNRAISYAQLLRSISATAAWLEREHGIGPGDHIVLIARNSPEFITLLVAAASLGAATALVNPRLAPPEIAAIVADSGARLVIADEETAATLDMPLLSLAILAAAAGETAAPLRDRADEFRPFALHYTSGTTGLPKGVPISHRSRVLSFVGMASEYGCYGPDDHFLAVAPLCHGAGLAFALAPLYTGGTVTLIDQFDPAELVRLTGPEITGLFLVPTHFRRIFELPQAAQDMLRSNRLKALISNAAPLPQPDKERVIDLFGEGRLFECYGATESGIITNLRPDMHRLKHNCVGTPFVATEVELRDDAGDPVADGAVGELFSRSPYLFDGYWRRPEDSAEAIRDGWVSVGDLARRDADGFYYIVDRKKDMILSGGMNIYPREIEAVLLQHAAVADVAVVGLADPDWGETIHAEIVLADGAAASSDELTALCRSQLAGYKMPRSMNLAGTIPRNSNGKVLKREIRARIEAERHPR